MFRGQTDKIGERTVDAEDMVCFVVNDDVIADGVEDFDPMTVRLLHAGEQASILERNAGMAGHSAQQLPVVGAGRRVSIGKAEHSNQFSRGAR